MEGLSPRDLQATRGQLPCHGSVVCIIVTLGAMPRKQVSFNLSRESCSRISAKIHLRSEWAYVRKN